MTEATIERIQARLDEARTKHPAFAPEGRFQAVSVVGEEYGEFAQAVNDGRMADSVDEALDTITTCVRYIEEVMA